MSDKIGINIVIERENVNDSDIFIASSPDVNIFTEGESIELAIQNFIEGAKQHLSTFPDERQTLIKKLGSENEMPMMTRVFL